MTQAYRRETGRKTAYISDIIGKENNYVKKNAKAGTCVREGTSKETWMPAAKRGCMQ